MELTLRQSVIGRETIANDYVVKFEDRTIGRIRQASERVGHNPGWDWTINPPLPVPAWCQGSEADLERAKAAFKQAWERFYETLTPADIKHWHDTADAAAERSGRK